LASLTNLTNLSLINNKISAINQRKSLTNLQTLDLFDNQVKDLRPLESLAKLRILNLYGNQITDLLTRREGEGERWEDVRYRYHL
jgi:internalin A